MIPAGISNSLDMSADVWIEPLQFFSLNQLCGCGFWDPPKVKRCPQILNYWFLILFKGDESHYDFFNKIGNSTVLSCKTLWKTWKAKGSRYFESGKWKNGPLDFTHPGVKLYFWGLSSDLQPVVVLENPRDPEIDPMLELCVRC
jgi:hypothetical protein